MRTKDEVELVDALLQLGLNDCEIARRTGIPRATIRDWRSGRRPNFDRGARFGLENEPTAIPAGAKAAYAYLLGLYLGDGAISRMRRTYRLRVTLDGIYPEIINCCRAAIATVFPNSVGLVKTPSRAIVVSVYSNALPRLFPQHGVGMKHTRTIALAPWQQDITHRYPRELIRGLIHSDGCRHMNTLRVKGRVYRYPRYEFCNHSDDIRAIFCEHLDLLGIPWRRMNRWIISVARRDAVARLDEFVGPKR